MHSQARRYLALAGAFLALTAGPATAQMSVPVGDAETVRAVKSALEQAVEVWGRAGVIDGGAGDASVGAAVGAGPAVSEATAVAGAALAWSVALLAASGVALDVHMARSGSIARFGNPYGVSAADIAFPLQRQLRARRARPPLAAPYPVPEPAPVPSPDERPDDRRPGRIYATYTIFNQETGRYYVGRTSAVIDLDQDWELQARAAVQARNGRRNSDERADPQGRRFRNAALDSYAAGLAVDYSQRYRDVAYLAIRGREQQLIDYHGAQRARELGLKAFSGGARSDTAPDEPLTENAIRGVARDNPLGEIFHAAANLAFGEMAPYTGDGRYQ